MAEIPQTDVSRRAALPTARIVSRSAQPTIDQNSAEYLDSIEEEWNKKVDVEVDTLVDGMVDLVSLASVSARSLGLVAGLTQFGIDWGQRQVPRRTGSVPGSVSC